MPGNSPYFFDTDNGIVYEYVVNGAILYCDGCPMSQKTGVSCLTVVSQNFATQNGELLGTAADNCPECILPFPNCNAGTSPDMLDFKTRVAPLKLAEASGCIPDTTKNPWQETHPFALINHEQALLCDPSDYTNSSKLFCHKGKKWIYILTSGQTIDEATQLAEFEKNRDTLIDILSKQFEEINTKANAENDYEVRPLSQTESRNGAKWYVDSMIGLMRAEKDENGFVNYYDLDENTQHSLAALARSSINSDPKGTYDENNLYSLGYSTDALASFSQSYTAAKYDSLLESELNSLYKTPVIITPEHTSLVFNSDMIDALAYCYIHPNSTRKNLWETGKLYFKYIILPKLINWGIGKLTTKAVSWWQAKNAVGGNLNIMYGNEPFSQSELNAAQYMAEQGHDVLLRPATGTRADGGTSDLLVDGINYDVYTPKTSNVSRIVGGIASKNSQTKGVVLDLSQTSVTADDLANVLQRVQGSVSAGGKEVNITDIVIIPK